MKAKYRRQVWKAGRTIEVMETYPTKFGDEMTRRRAAKPTREAVANYNRQMAIDRLGRIIAENFVPLEDLFVTLTYERGNRPSDYDTAVKHREKFINLLKREYGRYGVELKYVKSTAIGERGAVHHHLIINKAVPNRVIYSLWERVIHAGINSRPPDVRALYSTGEYSSLAAYFVDQFARGESTDEVKNRRRWTCSRNLKKPKEEPPQEISEIKWKEPPVPRAGYYIDTDSIRAGTNPVNGRPYLFYRMVKLPSDFVCFDNENGKQLTGSAAIAYFRRNNREWIRKNRNIWAPEGEIIKRE